MNSGQLTRPGHRRAGLFGFFLFLFLLATAVVLPSAVLVFSPLLPLKWYIFAILALLGLAFIFIFKNNKRFNLILITISLVFRIDVQLMYTATEVVRYRSFIIPFTLFPLGFLYLRWAVEILRERRSEKVGGRALLPILLFVAICSFSLLYAPEPDFSAFELFALAQSALIFIYFAFNIRKRRELWVIVWALAIGVALQGLLAPLQYLSGSSLGLEALGAQGETFERTLTLWSLSRAGGTMGHPNILSMHLDIFLPVILAAALLTRELGKRLILGAAFFLGLIGQLATLSRAGILASALAIIAFLWFWAWRQERMSLVLGLVLLVIAFTTLFIFTTDNPVSERFFEHDYGAAYSRIPMMKVATRVIENNLFLGVGLNNYTAIAPRYDNTRERISTLFPFPVHIYYLHVLAELGIFGLLVITCFILVVVLKGLSLFNNPDLEVASIGTATTFGIIAILFHITVNMLSISIFFSFWMACGMIISLWHYARLRANETVDLTEKSDFPIHRATGSTP